MNRLLTVSLAAVLLAGCSSSVPRNPAVFTPTEPPAVGSAQPAGSSDTSFDTSAWITLAPQGEGFSVLMPCTATSASGSGPAVGGNYTYTYWTCTDSSGRGFLVSLTKFAKGALSGPAKPILDNTQSRYLGQYPGAKVESQSDITLDGHAGRTGVFASSTTRIHGEIFIVGDTGCIVGVSYPVGLADNGVANAFLASFKLTV